MENTPPLFDLHEDLGYHIYIHGEYRLDMDNDDKPADIPSYRRANTKVFVGAVFALPRGYSKYGSTIEAMYGFKGDARDIYIRPSMPKAHALDVIMIYHWLVRRYSDFKILWRWDPDPNKINIVLGLEGTDYLDEPGDIYLYQLLGIRLLGLTWNYDTRFAATCMSRKDYGLTGLGSELIDLCEELGIVVDLAHASRNTMLDVLSVASKPVVISHANYNGVYRHPRNVDDRVLERLDENRGVIGFTYIKETIGERGSVEELALHIDAVARQYGHDLVALGTDLFGCNPPDKLTRIDGVTHLYNELLKLDWTWEMINKFSYGNAERVFSEVIKG